MTNVSEQFLLELLPILAVAVGVVFAAVGIALAGYLAVTLVARTLPARVRQTSDDALELATAAVASVEQMRAEWATRVEELERLSDQIERRRKQVQQAASKMEQAEAKKGSATPSNGSALPDGMSWEDRLGVGRY